MAFPVTKVHALVNCIKYPHDRIELAFSRYACDYRGSKRMIHLRNNSLLTSFCFNYCLNLETRGKDGANARALIVNSHAQFFFNFEKILIFFFGSFDFASKRNRIPEPPLFKKERKPSPNMNLFELEIPTRKPFLIFKITETHEPNHFSRGLEARFWH